MAILREVERVEMLPDSLMPSCIEVVVEERLVKSRESHKLDGRAAWLPALLS